MAKELYFEDFEAGQVYEAGEYVMTKDDIFAFAREYDPQPQHLDEEAAKRSIWGQLVASGWHTSAATMRLKCESALGRVAGGLVGMGIDEMKWPRPVYPGDVLRLAITVLDKRMSKSKPDKGIVFYKAETFNQKNELVMEMKTAVIVPKRG